MPADLYNQHTRAPTPEEVAPLVRHFFGAAGESPELQSLIAGMHVVRDLFADKFRKKRSEESIFWHNFRVTLDVYQRSGGDLLKTFIASQHDVPEDSRETKHPYSPAQCASLWNGSTDSKKLIADVLKLKTDEEGLDGDVRRARQHQHVVKAAAGGYGKAGFIFAEVMFADKKDNLLADREDAQAGRLHFKTSEKALEFVFKKISDAQIVEELPIDQCLQDDFRANYEALMRHVIKGRYFPIPLRHNPFAPKPVKPRLLLMRYLPLTGRQLHHDFAMDIVRVILPALEENIDIIRQGHVDFPTRSHALAFSFVVAAQIVLLNAAPVPDQVKQDIRKPYNALMRELLYAGNIIPRSVVGNPRIKVKSLPKPSS